MKTMSCWKMMAALEAGILSGYARVWLGVGENASMRAVSERRYTCRIA